MLDPFSVFLRSIIAFFVLLVMARLMGKKQVSQLTFFDYCVGITIGSIASMISIDKDVKLLSGSVAILTWSLFPMLLSFINMKSTAFAKVVDGKPSLLIHNGKILKKNLKRNKLTVQELLMLLREKGAFHIDDVKFAILETNGKISVSKKGASPAVTPTVMGDDIKYEQAPTILIIDGKWHKANMEKKGIQKEWLEDELQRQGITKVDDVFLAQIDTQPNLYIHPYENGSIRDSP